MKIKFKNTLMVWALLGLSTSASFAQHNEFKKSTALEPLYGIQMGEQQITIQVKSNGCTRSEHFEIKLNETEQSPELTIKRLGRDHCRRMPFVKRIKLSFDTDQDEFVLMNPLSIWKATNRQ
jgi:hypothetical protein